MTSNGGFGTLQSSNDRVTELKNKMYDVCGELWAEDNSMVFRQNDLMSLDVIDEDDLTMLMQVMQRLCDEKLFKLVRDGPSNVGWMYRPVADAAKYRGLNREQEMVYTIVDDAGAEGIWSKTIKGRCNLHESTLQKVIKWLEGKRLIQQLKSVEHLNRKMYIKANIQASEKATGGAFHTDGELDYEFITAISEQLYGLILSKSFYRSTSMGRTHRPKSTTSNGTTASSQAIKRTAAGKEKMSREDATTLRDAGLEGQHPRIKSEKPEDSKRASVRSAPSTSSLLPLPPGFKNYPTLSELTLFIENSGISNTTLTADDISQLLDVMVYDKLIERVKGPDGEVVAFRATRKTAEEIEEGVPNGITEAPCGRCPVFDLCEEGGPVSPSNCEYFAVWLQQR